MLMCAVNALLVIKHASARELPDKRADRRGVHCEQRFRKECLEKTMPQQQIQLSICITANSMTLSSCLPTSSILEKYSQTLLRHCMIAPLLMLYDAVHSKHVNKAASLWTTRSL